MYASIIFFQTTFRLKKKQSFYFSRLLIYDVIMSSASFVLFWNVWLFYVSQWQCNSISRVKHRIEVSRLQEHAFNHLLFLEVCSIAIVRLSIFPPQLYGADVVNRQHCLLDLDLEIYLDLIKLFLLHRSFVIQLCKRSLGRLCDVFITGRSRV